MKRAFVIGHPIAHSRSPLIHTYWLQRYGIAGSYEAIDVPPEALSDFLQRLRDGELVGGNATIPLKELALKLCDLVAEDARTIGAVNTLSRTRDEAGQLRLYGENTDVYGFLANLDEGAPGWSSNPGPAVVVGAGGAARAVLAALSQRGFSPIHILNRTVQRAETLAKELSPNLGTALLAGPLSALDEVGREARLLVNTSAIGMHGEAPPPLAGLPADVLVTDIVYTPLVTPLLDQARRNGLRTVDGLGMLLHQAVPGFERWFGTRPEVTPELRQLVEASL